MINNPIVGAQVKYTGTLWQAIHGKVGTIVRIDAGEFPACWTTFGSSYQYPLYKEVLEDSDFDLVARQEHAMSLL